MQSTHSFSHADELFGIDRLVVACGKLIFMHVRTLGGRAGLERSVLSDAEAKTKKRLTEDRISHHFRSGKSGGSR